jgi:glycosyltransferase involved in cell wall biosynthesis
MQSWDIVVQPSRKEAFGIAVVEAMAMAKPVVATRTEGIPEILHDGENGRLVDADDPAGLAMILSELRTDPDQRARLGQGARRTAERRYSIEGTVAEFEKLYSSLLVNPRR